MPIYGKRQVQSDQILESDKKSQKIYAFLYEKIDKGTDTLISEEYNYEDTNYYHPFKQDNYESDALN